ncbi:MAG: hypothetical protein ACYS21_11620, partial [Planctomycetota bacterium]
MLTKESTIAVNCQFPRPAAAGFVGVQEFLPEPGFAVSYEGRKSSISQFSVEFAVAYSFGDVLG